MNYKQIISTPEDWIGQQLSFHLIFCTCQKAGCWHLVSANDRILMYKLNCINFFTKIETACSSGMLVNICQAIWHNISENSNFHFIFIYAQSPTIPPIACPWQVEKIYINNNSYFYFHIYAVSMRKHSYHGKTDLEILTDLHTLSCLNIESHFWNTVFMSACENELH